MHWLEQKDTFNAHTTEAIHHGLETIEKMGATYSYVKMVPFVGTLIPDEPIQGPIFALGSTTMMRVAMERKWSPGVIFNENFRYEAWKGGYGNHLINRDGVVSRFEDAVPPVHLRKIFVRPCEDLKSFSGHLTDSETFLQWRDGILASDREHHDLPIRADTMVVISEPKIMLREWRLFVVGRRVVDASQYRAAGYGLSLSTDVDKDVLDFGQQMVDVWSPADHFVLDIAATPDR